MVDAAELCAALTIGSISGAVGGRSTNIMTKSQTFTEAVSTALFGIFLAIAGAGGAAQAQTSGAVQQWGLPPLPAGVGPVEKFAASATRRRVSSSKAERSTLKAICGSWRSAVGGFDI
jgi:hypothetical protein